jgi:cytidine deaminase
MQPKAKGPELIFAFVGAMGIDRDLVYQKTVHSLSEVDYRCGDPIRLTDLFEEINREPWRSLPRAPEDVRYKAYIEAGDLLRQRIGAGALALGALGKIRELRALETGSEIEPAPRRAYLLWSLKHPAEASLLRQIYGSRLIIVGTYSRRDKRKDYLASKIAASRGAPRAAAYEGVADELLNTDEEEGEKKFGQKVRYTFPLADVFVDPTDPTQLEIAVSRFVELLFGNTLHTPDKGEHAMFHAFGAAPRSASLSRQVGAVITTNDGDILTVGSNEVPKAGGGQYWPGDEHDSRDHMLPEKEDTSDRMKRYGLRDMLGRLRDAGWLAPARASLTLEELVEDALFSGDPSMMDSAQLMNLIEYGRSVHAEMAALINAARYGIKTKGTILYTTTFPCHDCARHIVAAGIERVVYVDPYPKSLAPEFHKDSIVVEKPKEYPEQVIFEPFVGVAHRRYLELFAMLKRKDRKGKVIPWEETKAEAWPRGVEPAAYYVAAEEVAWKEFRTRMDREGL